MTGGVPISRLISLAVGAAAAGTARQQEDQDVFHWSFLQNYFWPPKI
jgi:hypothetical protein